MLCYSAPPRAWWLTIAQEYAAGMSGPKLAKKCGVGNTRTIYLILEKVRRQQADTSASTHQIVVHRYRIVRSRTSTDVL
jgi:hypothetical protein